MFGTMKIHLTITLLILGLVGAQERTIRSGSVQSSRRSRFLHDKPPTFNFNCPKDFGYYAHPVDCSKYFVCVFGGPLLESCSGGLMYSHDLQTCDWPRNVLCNHKSRHAASSLQDKVPASSGREENLIHSATESFTPAILSRGIDNAIRTRLPLKISSKKLIFGEESKIRQGRFLTKKEAPKSVNRRFEAQETSSRSFNVVPTPQIEKAKVAFPPSLPTVSNTNRFNLNTGVQQSTQKASVDKIIYNDFLNITDPDYYYYYDDILFDDYYEPPVKTTTTPKPRRSSSRSNGINRKTSSAFSDAPSNSNQRDSSRFSSQNFFSPSPAPFLSEFPLEKKSSSDRTGGPRGAVSSSVSSSTKKSGRTSSRNSNTRGSSRSKPNHSKLSSTSGGGTPKLFGRTPQRPAPLYPQPQVDTLAEKCDPNKCRLPDCFCGGLNLVPGNIPPQNVPQMVLLTFDDSVNDLNKKLYVELFEKGRINPNGCPISGTFYISHEWTDYSQVQNLYSDGHEIASHSITHSFGEQYSTKTWAQEIGGQREIMSAYGGVRLEDVRGMRAPFLAIGGNNMFRMLYDLNFTYDSSMPVYENNPPSYPYTLDYKIFHDCMIPPCPKNSYPGVWQVPMVMWQDLKGGRCSMADACTTPPDAEGVYKMLIKNFERHYTTSRAPMGLYYHAAWFTTPHHKEGFIAFLDTIAKMDDVWLVTNWQALQWVRDPTPLNKIKSFAPFLCDYPERPPRCNSPRVCNVWHKGSVRYMKTCHSCPKTYPWTGKTGVPGSSLNKL